jgi:hypothetical protein
MKRGAKEMTNQTAAGDAKLQLIAVHMRARAEVGIACF